jgi:hypothetical protein
MGRHFFRHIKKLGSYFFGEVSDEELKRLGLIMVVGVIIFLIVYLYGMIFILRRWW